MSSDLTAGRNTDVATGLVRGTVRLFSEMGLSAVVEMPLRSGRRVDVMAIARDGRITVVEVKSSPADFRSDNKWPEYLDYCDYFYFAVPVGFPVELLPEHTGLIVADRYDATIVRPASEQAMNGARRRNVTLRFARAAAERLCRLTDDAVTR